ncbi:hypothetical protein [Tenacibaculum ovolyticum]|uniref:hypothetical protein n=1 Tax=Tenacibaculum ovolyticum TaxID=104270 RepID=UPI000419DCA7|nr:hypothetical protein [Tenacibaculum ovolyticum]
MTKYKINNIQEVQDRIDMDDLLGCIKYKNKYHFFLSDITSWVLNYSKYDPTINIRNKNFKNGILNVEQENKTSYLEYLKDDFFKKDLLDEYQSKMKFMDLHLYFFIDFDINFYVNGYPENLSPEEYLPNESWKSVINDPVLYLPESLARYWGKDS